MTIAIDQWPLTLSCPLHQLWNNDLLVVVLDDYQHRWVGSAEFSVQSLETCPVFVRAVGQLPRASDGTWRQLSRDLREDACYIFYHTLHTLGHQNEFRSSFYKTAWLWISIHVYWIWSVWILTSLTCWASSMTLCFSMLLKPSGSVETEAFCPFSSTDTICTETICVWLTNPYTTVQMFEVSRILIVLFSKYLH